jgi:glycosyltransferase involved in cell wall biosynthesis
VRRLRVAIGPAEIAGTSTALAEGLRSLGVDAEVAFWSPLPGPFASDRALRQPARALYGAAAPLRRDVLHYQYGSTWLPRAVDAAWGRAFGRTVVVTYHGDDCRLAETARRLDWPIAPVTDPANDPFVRRRVARLARFGHAAIVGDLEVASYVQPFYPRVYVSPLPLHNRRAPSRSRSSGGRIRVLHAPSDQRVKGTDRIRRAVEAVAERLPLEFVVLTGVSHDAVREELARTDIVVDQLGSPSASVFALEAMRAGVPVLSRVDGRALAPFHASLPVVGVTAESLQRKLEEAASDSHLRRRLGEDGKAYVARHHEASQAARAVLRVYAHARQRETGVFEATAEGVAPLSSELFRAAG